MTVSTKIFLAGVVIVILSLAAYYGILGPGDEALQDGETVPTEPSLDQSAMDRELSEPAPADSDENHPTRFAASDTPSFELPATEPSSGSGTGTGDPGIRGDDGGAGSVPPPQDPVALTAEPGREETGSSGIPARIVTPSPVRVNSSAYIVRKYDTLWSIAENRYGDGNKWKLIVEANPDLASGVLRVGQRIRLPSVENGTNAGSGASANSPPARTHTVRTGETLSSIAQRYYRSASRWQTIFQANRDTIGDDPNRLKVGMTLTIPAN